MQINQKTYTTRPVGRHYAQLQQLQPAEQIRLELGDARDLSQVANASFGLVVFSLNGIDAVSHCDRLQILQEVY